LVLKRGVEGFTMQDVADAAGVSVRTVYRYFPSREAFAEDLRHRAQHVQEKIAEKRGDGDWHSNPEFMASSFEDFEENADFVKASRVMREAGSDMGGSYARTERIREQVLETGLSPEVVDQFVGLIRLLGGSDAWMRLTENDIGLPSREAGYAVQWAMEVLTEAVRNEQGPLRPSGEVEM
jgi:AcrR family transcriptional regulator